MEFVIITCCYFSVSLVFVCLLLWGRVFGCLLLPLLVLSCYCCCCSATAAAASGLLLLLQQNAYNLGWKLARVLKQGASPQLLDSYAAEVREAAGEQQQKQHTLLLERHPRHEGSCRGTDRRQQISTEETGDKCSKGKQN